VIAVVLHSYFPVVSLKCKTKDQWPVIVNIRRGQFPLYLVKEYQLSSINSPEHATIYSLLLSCLLQLQECQRMRFVFMCTIHVEYTPLNLDGF
jgi:hypothetical protein